MSAVSFDLALEDTVHDLVEAHIAADADPVEIMRVLDALAEHSAAAANRLREFIKTHEWSERI
mgnify:CR=1 FL=1